MALSTTAARVAAAALVAGTLFAGSTVFAQQNQTAPAAPAQTEAPKVQRFEHWALVCPQNADCYIKQDMIEQQGDQQRVRMSTAIGFQDKEAGTLGIAFRMPPAIKQETGMGIKIDEANPMTLPIDECNDQYCESRASLGDDVYQMMRKGNQAVVAAKTKNDENWNALISFKGFTAASNALMATRR